MRVTRPLALVLIVMAAPLSRANAQTCEGTAAFQDGRARVGVYYQDNSVYNDAGATFSYGIPRSFYGGISVDDLRPTRPPSVGNLSGSSGGSSYVGGGVALGYQIHISDTPFQLCPEVSWHYGTNAGTDIQEFGFGGSAGYRVPISDWFTLVPAVGVRWISTSGSYGGGNQSDDDVFMLMGLVFNKTFTIQPGFFVPSPTGSKTVYTIAVSVNWGHAVSR